MKNLVTPASVKGEKLDMNAGKPRKKSKWKSTISLDLMVLPALILTLIFAYIPMTGLAIAFKNYKPGLGFSGSKWVGLEHFEYLFSIPENVQIIWNTLIIAGLKMIAGLIVPFLFALLLNEIRKMAFKKTVQTIVYMPHFLSWVILGGILSDLLARDGGLINQVLVSVFGIQPIFFLGDGNWFRFVVVVSDVWKEFGFNTIVFLASLAGINPALYEAAEVDGAGRWQQTLAITMPAMLPITIVVGTLALGNVLNGGFDQIFNLYNALVFDKGDIIDTFVYRLGIVDGKFSFSTAVGLFKSVVSFVLIVSAYRISYKFANYRIF
ncbi:putative aldouronate transport system permease protein [Paenibacillus sp. PastF-1]|nr:putative aldouronate transport system permease protein [Paenibacillus sp. PastF-2]MDF9850254.1 putative aldouronate transport system permease protein [Paenibacillus sp. PastM-2]MDF9856806.1 putative aldouronate transport system permease protein [Paenibacillus sp. PastF-1]MDH6482101.1 putative aldouronate transport system permease protein [Paenibacillus sp. PastH-2]MDH6509523.1 putative aldouronate transport system permease protein [Paenibacillus sp. PastM-3]